MISELKSIKIGRAAQRALEEIGIDMLIQLSDHTEKELLAIHGIGPKAVKILKRVSYKKVFLSKSKNNYL